MRVTILDLKSMKCRDEKIAMITAYDYTAARIVEESGIPIILVGDSLGMVMLGYDSTIPVTMDEMVHHVKSVVRGTHTSHIVSDMPFLSYHTSISESVKNAGRLLKEGGAHSVKLEGGRHVRETVQSLVQYGIPVMGHIGLTPQAIHQLGGYKVQGKSPKEAVTLLEDARILEEAGAYSIVLECIPSPLSELITKSLSIPTIGIGSGPYCDGQVQVFHDMLGLFSDFVPKHARRYANLDNDIKKAVATYIEDIKTQSFPSEKESYSMKDDVLRKIKDQIAERT